MERAPETSPSLLQLFAAESAIVDQLYSQMLREANTTRRRLQKPSHLKHRTLQHKLPTGQASAAICVCSSSSKSAKSPPGSHSGHVSATLTNRSSSETQGPSSHRESTFCRANFEHPAMSLSRTSFTLQDSASRSVDSLYCKIIEGSSIAVTRNLKRPPWVKACLYLSHITSLTPPSPRASLRRESNSDSSVADSPQQRSSQIFINHAMLVSGEVSSPTQCSHLQEQKISKHMTKSLTADTNVTFTEEDVNKAPCSCLPVRGGSGATGNRFIAAEPATVTLPKCKKRRRRFSKTRVKRDPSNTLPPQTVELNNETAVSSIAQEQPSNLEKDKETADHAVPDEDARSDISLLSDCSGFLPSTKYRLSACNQSISQDETLPPRTRQMQSSGNAASCASSIPNPKSSYRKRKSTEPAGKEASDSCNSSPQRRKAYSTRKSARVNATISRKQTSFTPNSRKRKPLADRNITSYIHSVKRAVSARTKQALSRNKSVKTQRNVPEQNITSGSKASLQICKIQRAIRVNAEGRASLQGKNRLGEVGRDAACVRKKLEVPKRSRGRSPKQPTNVKNIKTNKVSGSRSNQAEERNRTKKRRSITSNSSGSARRKKSRLDNSSRAGATSLELLSKQSSIVAHHKRMSSEASSGGALSLFSEKDVLSQLCQLEERAKAYDVSMMQTFIPLTEKSDLGIYKQSAVQRYSSVYAPNQNSHVGGVWKSIFSKR